MAVDQIGGTRDFPVEAPDYTPGQRRRVIGAASLGWGMEYFDFMLPSLLAPQIERAFHISPGAFSIAIVVQLVGSAVGGLLFGWLGDLFERTDEQRSATSALWGPLQTTLPHLSASSLGCPTIRDPRYFSPRRGLTT